MTAPLLTPTELAEYLNVKVATVKDWRRHRTGPPAFHVGGAVRYRLADVDAWLEAQRDDPAVPRPVARTRKAG